MNKKEILGLCEFLKLHGYENTDNISKFIFELQKENKQLKMVVDNLKKYLELNIELIKEQPSNDELTDNFILKRFKSLLEMLEEV